MTKRMYSMKPYYKILLSCAVLAVLPGCGSGNFYHESYVSENKVQLSEDRFYQEIPLEQASDAYLSNLASTYARYGGDGLKITVTYDPESHLHSGRVASSDLARITSSLRGRGVTNVQGDILPVNGKGYQATVIVAYTSYEAQAPKDCGTMPGFESSSADYDQEYALGCTSETLFARQIAHPRDLKGRAQSPELNDGRAIANVIDQQRTGAQNEPLDGESASGTDD